MTDYSQPYTPNILSDAQAANSLQNFFNNQSDRNALQSAGQMAAGGNFPGASNTLLAQGMLPQAKQFSDYANAQSNRNNILSAGKAMAGNEDYDFDPATKLLLQGGLWDEAKASHTLIKTLDADKAKDVADTNAHLGEMAKQVLLAPKEQQAYLWGKTLQIMQGHNLDISKLQDPVTGPMYALALAQNVDAFHKDDLARRSNELFNYKAQKQFSVQIPGAEGEEQRQGIVNFGPNGWGTPQVAPAGVDVNEPIGGKGKSQQSTGIERIADNYQDDWRAQHGHEPGFKELPRTEALNAASIANRNNSGTGMSFEPDASGIPRLKTSGQLGTSGYVKTEEGAYNIKGSQQRAIADTAVDARNQLGSVVTLHAQQLDKIASSPELPAALTWLHTPQGALFLAGKLTDLGNVPAVANDLKMTINSLAHEYGNFVAAGHKGAMSEREGADLQGIVDQLRQSPDARTLMHGVDTLRDLAGAFQSVRKLGPQQRVIPGQTGERAEAASARGTESGPVPVSSPEEARKLPRGTPIRLPDGSIGRVP
jgi:hypothetical protein